jgi:hypothetical protein
MGQLALSFGLGVVALLCSASSLALAGPREPTDVYIRRLAGLPAASAVGQIEITDVGHGPMDTMLSIVGHRTVGGWAVSYACAASPHCAPSSDHLALSYALSGPASDEVDRILATLRSGAEPDGQPPSPNIIGGYLTVSIDDGGFKRDYRRIGAWGKTLGRLEALLLPPQ